MSTGLRARPGRRQHGVERRERVSGESRASVAAEIDQAVDCEHADAAAVGQDREALSRERLLPAERLGGREELVEIEHAQEPGAPEGGVVDRVGAGERAGMGRGRLRGLRVAARLDHDDGLRARRGARGGHELARIADRFDVEQDRAGRAVGGEVVEAIAEIDVDLVAEGDDGGEADTALRRPFDEPRRDGARLRDEGEIAGSPACAPRNSR